MPDYFGRPCVPRNRRETTRYRLKGDEIREIAAVKFILISSGLCQLAAESTHTSFQCVNAESTLKVHLMC